MRQRLLGHVAKRQRPGCTFAEILLSRGPFGRWTTRSSTGVATPSGAITTRSVDQNAPSFPLPWAAAGTRSNDDLGAAASSSGVARARSVAVSASSPGDGSA
jgi:hypothetical protein